MRERLRVGQLGALRLARGARGVEEHRDVLRGGAGQARGWFEDRQRCGEGSRLDLDQLCPGVGGSHSRLLGEAVPGEQELRARVLQVEGDLSPLQEHVHRHDDATGAQHAVVGDREVGDVGQHHPDPVPRRDPPLPQQRRQAGAAVVELRVAQPDLAEPDRRRPRRPLGAGGEQRCEVEPHLRPRRLRRR